MFTGARHAAFTCNFNTLRDDDSIRICSNAAQQSCNASAAFNAAFDAFTSACNEKGGYVSFWHSSGKLSR